MTYVDPMEASKMLLASLIKKQNILEKCDEGILELLTDDDEIGKEIEETSKFDDRIIEAMTKLEGYVILNLWCAFAYTPKIHFS